MSYMNVFVMKRLKNEYELILRENNENAYYIKKPDLTVPKWEGHLIDQYTKDKYPFYIIFSNKYPHDPPKIFFYTKRPPIPVAFTTNGEMCLDLLETFTGDHPEYKGSWSPACSVNILLISIQSMIKDKGRKRKG